MKGNVNIYSESEDIEDQFLEEDVAANCLDDNIYELTDSKASISISQVIKKRVNYMGKIGYG